MRITTSTTGVPAWLRSALLPIPAAASPKASSYGLVDIVGAPGTRAVPAPRPAAIPETAANWRANQGSYAAPPIMFPSIYYVASVNRPPVPVRSHTPMPVPARSVRSLAGIAQRMRRVGGQSQIGQPAALQTWPQWKPGAR